MRKKLYSFLTALFIIVPMLLSSLLPVNAGVKYEMTQSGYYITLATFSGANFMIKKYEGNPVYCIEPGIEASLEEIYEIGELKDYANMSEEQKQHVAEFMYFGYGYKTYCNGEDFAATQYLIWDELNPVFMQGAHFYTQNKGENRDEVIHAAMDRIRQDIASYHADVDLSLAGSSYGMNYQGTGDAGETYTFTDTNDALKDMTLVQNDFGDAMQWQGDTVTIHLSSSAIGKHRLRFEKNSELTGQAPMALYDAKTHYQMMGMRGDINKYATIELDTKVPVWIQKSDEQGNSVAGSSLQLIDDADQSVIDTWVSTEQPHKISSLQGDHHYTVLEQDAPVGHYYAKPVTFVLVETDHITVVDETIPYIVEKKDEKDKYVKGAQLALYDVSAAEKQLIKEWQSGLQSEDIGSLLKAGHSYSIVEKDVSTKYFLAEDTDFTVSRYPEGNVHTINIRDGHICYALAKVDEEGNAVKDAGLVITDLTDPEDLDRVVLEWHSTESPLIVNMFERGHTYKIKETAYVDGHYAMEDKVFTVPQSAAEPVIQLSCVDTRITYRFQKTDEENRPVSGAEITLYEKNAAGEQPIRSFVTKDVPEVLQGLRNDTDYVLKETKVPAGYYPSAPVSFHVEKFGTAAPVTITMEDQSVQVKLKKTDKQGNMLAGALLRVCDEASGKEIGQYETKQEEPISIGNVLEAGHTYTITEIQSPDGYYVAEDIRFTVPADGSEKEILVELEDDPIHVQFEKTDLDGSLLAGAHLALYQEAEKIVEWTSGEKTFDLSSYLKAGMPYRIEETQAPDGYYVSLPLNFTVGVTAPKEDVLLQMQDIPVQYAIKKIDEAGNPVSHVRLRLSEVAETGDTLIREWETTLQEEEFVHVLCAGHTYRLQEVALTPGYAAAPSQLFTVPLQGTIHPVLISMLDATNAISFRKTDEKGSPLAGAELQILDEKKNVVASFTSNAEVEGVSELEDGTSISSILNAGGYYFLHEVKAPFGYETAADIPFIMSGTLASPQTIVMLDKAMDVYVKVKKRGAEENMPLLSDCQITVLDKETEKKAYDLTGKEAEALTDENGSVEFRLPYTPKGYLVQETKAPEGYAIDTEKKELIVDEADHFDPAVPQNITIVDAKNVDTGEEVPYHAYMALLCACGCLLLMKWPHEKA